ncbi:hypothetical protein ACFYVR_13820 [Rhodococcus sp. NPDC003318]|uniref:hypothetical protein n=1 Tax=Rhodococcus sp. NPDC003318 TaxID=3364503 RepID=UPI0036887295
MSSITTEDLERAWVGLGERVDRAGDTAAPAFLTRLTLLLAAELGDTERFLALADKALAAGRDADN